MREGFYTSTQRGSDAGAFLGAVRPQSKCTKIRLRRFHSRRMFSRPSDRHGAELYPSSRPPGKHPPLRRTPSRHPGRHLSTRHLFPRAPGGMSSSLDLSSRAPGTPFPSRDNPSRPAGRASPFHHKFSRAPGIHGSRGKPSPEIFRTHRRIPHPTVAIRHTRIGTRKPFPPNRHGQP